MRDDLILAAAMLALAAGFAALASRIPTSLLSDAVGAGGLPRLFALLLALLALLVAARAALAREAGGTRWREHLRPFGIVAIGAIYIALTPLVGYIVALALLIAAAIAYFGARARLMIAANAIGGAVLLWLVFARMLGISMPAAAWARLVG